MKHTASAAYTHVFALQPFDFLNHDVLQDLVVEDLSQLQTVLCKIWNKTRQIINYHRGSCVKPRLFQLRQ